METKPVLSIWKARWPEHYEVRFSDNTIDLFLDKRLEYLAIMKDRNSKPIIEILDAIVVVTVTHNQISFEYEFTNLVLKLKDYEIFVRNCFVIQLIIHRINVHKKAIEAMYKAISFVLRDPSIIVLYNYDFERSFGGLEEAMRVLSLCYDGILARFSKMLKNDNFICEYNYTDLLNACLRDRNYTRALISPIADKFFIVKEKCRYAMLFNL